MRGKDVRYKGPSLKTSQGSWPQLISFNLISLVPCKFVGAMMCGGEE